MALSLTAYVHDKEVIVEKFAREGLYFASPVGEVGSILSLVFCANTAGIALELPTTGKVHSTAGGQLIAVEFTDAQNSALRSLLNANEAKPFGLVKRMASTFTEGMKPTPLKKTPQLMAFAALGIALSLVIGGLVSRRGSVIVAPAAVVASSGLSLESSVAGRLEYLANGKNIAVGEIFAAIRTISGRSIYLESGISGTLRAAGLNVGEKVVKGDKLFQVTNPNDRYYVNAYLSSADVVAIARGYNVEVHFNDTSGTSVMLPRPVQISDIVTSKKFSDDAGNMLVEVHLPLVENLGRGHVGESVDVKFLKANTLLTTAVSGFLVNILDGAKLLNQWLKS